MLSILRMFSKFANQAKQIKKNVCTTLKIKFSKNQKVFYYKTQINIKLLNILFLI